MTRRRLNVTRARAQQPISEELPRLLEERRLSYRWLSQRIGKDATFLSRAVRASHKKKVSRILAGEIAVALGLPEDYFFEYRQAVVIEGLAKHPDVVDDAYEQIRERERRTDGHR